MTDTKLREALDLAGLCLSQGDALGARKAIEAAKALAAPAAEPELDAGVVRDAWRLLNTGDRIESADEVLHADCVTWGPIVGWEVGVIYSTTVFMPIRRKVAAAMSAQGGGK
jgi:hypothetical protein